jgi:uncharacterized C2H2 Zn-finger protein
MDLMLSCDGEFVLCMRAFGICKASKEAVRHVQKNTQHSILEKTGFLIYSPYKLRFTKRLRA